MTKKTLRSILYNFLCFALLYSACYFSLKLFTALVGYWVPITSAVVASILSPKFQAVKTAKGEKLFVKWIFIKDVKEIK